MNKYKEAFKDHLATKVIDNERLLVIDLRKKDGSSEYYINFIVDKKNGTLTISGDLGYSVATWHNEISPSDLKAYVNSYDYYVEKIRCSTDLYMYNDEDIISELTNEISDEDIEAYLEEDVEWTLISEIRKTIKNEVYNSMNGKDFIPTANLRAIIDAINPDINERLHLMGREIDTRVKLWAAGYNIACEQLNI